MPRLAKAYLIIILTLGALGLILALRQWECGDPVRYAIYALAALLAACFKVRLPGMQGTISISFVVVLIGVAELSLPETLVMAAVVAVMQSVWKCKRRPQAVQVLFNSAVLVISAGAAYGLSHAVMGVMGRDDLIVEMAVAACVYFVANTVMVSGILGLLRHESVMAVWKNCHLWSFPYYVAGAAVAVLSALSCRSSGWHASLLVLPVMQLAYLYYRAYIERLGFDAGHVAGQ